MYRKNQYDFYFYYTHTLTKTFAILGYFQRSKIPRATGVIVIANEMSMLMYGITRFSSVQLPLYISKFRGISPKARTVDTVVIDILQQAESGLYCYFKNLIQCKQWNGLFFTEQEQGLKRYEYGYMLAGKTY